MHTVTQFLISPWVALTLTLTVAILAPILEYPVTRLIDRGKRSDHSAASSGGPVVGADNTNEDGQQGVLNQVGHGNTAVLNQTQVTHKTTVVPAATADDDPNEIWDISSWQPWLGSS